MAQWSTSTMPTVSGGLASFTAKAKLKSPVSSVVDGLGLQNSIVAECIEPCQPLPG